MINKNVILTVFTPTYNRKNTLKRTYSSLCNQTCKDFVWLVVDDGSTDGTANLVNRWRADDNDFEIQYIYKENGGMHTAHNVAYANIKTELNTCIDSDDSMPPNAVKVILDTWEQIRDKGYAGIMALDADMATGKIIGKGFPNGAKEMTATGYYAGGGSGDKKLIYRTDIINSVPSYPEFPGEKYVALAYKYILVDQSYKMFLLNEVVCDVEYLQTGSTNTMFDNYLQNPNGWIFWRKIQMTYPYNLFHLLKNCIHYCSSCIIAQKQQIVKNSPKKLLTVICFPFGWILSKYIKNKARI